MILGYAILISAMYAVAALLWLIAWAVRLKTRSPRMFRFMEWTGMQSAGFAMGLTIAVLLALLFRWIGWFPTNGG